MRVIAGKLGGQLFESPYGHRTHPMSEKMRGAIFGMLGDIDGLTFLDAFSGSGALALEAVSRGADRVTAIEVDKRAADVIKRNAEKLGISEQVKVVRAYANAWSTRHQSEMFDVILLDPPYDKLPLRDLSVLPRHLKEEGVLILSWPAKADWYPFNGLKMIQSRNYGDGTLHVYQRL